MAAINWMVNGSNVTEAVYDAFQAQRAIDLQRWLASGAGQPIATAGAPTERPSPLDVQATTSGSLSGQKNRIPLTFIAPFGWIPSGTANLVDAFQQGFRYLDGQWLNTSITTPPVVIGIPTATTVPTATTISTGGPRPTAAAVIIPFVGGPMENIRLTTGIGAETGALAPIRMGMAGGFLPRIIMNDIAT